MGSVLSWCPSTFVLETLDEIKWKSMGLELLGCPSSFVLETSVEACENVAHLLLYLKPQSKLSVKDFSFWELVPGNYALLLLYLKLRSRLSEKVAPILLYLKPQSKLSVKVLRLGSI